MDRLRYRWNLIIDCRYYTSHDWSNLVRRHSVFGTASKSDILTYLSFSHRGGGKKTLKLRDILVVVH